MRPTARALALLATTTLAIGGLAAPAYAASPVIVSRAPAADSYQATRPSGVSIVFDQNIATTSTMSVAGPAGASPCTKSAPLVNVGTTLSCSFATPSTTTVPDGSYTVSYTANSTGADLATTGNYTFHVDATVPGAPTLVSTTPANGGSRKSTGFTYAATANETLASSSRVDVFDDTLTQVAVTKVVSGSTVTVTPVGALPEGAYTAKVYLVDVSGRAPDFVGRTFTIDDTAPVPPVIGTPLPKINIANATAFPVSGTGEAGAVVTLTSGAATTTATVNGSNAWTASINVSALADGPVTFTATQKDAADNASTASAPASTTKDTVRPRVTNQAAAPTFLNIADTTATVSGKVDNGATTAGEADPVTISADDAGAPGTAPVVASTTAAADGTFVTTLSTSSLNDGTITYTFVATDDFSNPSTAVTATNTKDTVAPGAPTVVVTPAPINSGNQTDVTVSGTAGGTTAFITLSDGPGGGSDITFNDTVSAGAYSNSFDTTTLADGTITVTVTSTDAAGNSGPAGSTTVTKDTVAPSTPTVSVAPAPINAASQSAVTASGDTTGDTVTITLSDGVGGGADITTTATVSSGSYSKVIDTSTLEDGDIDVSVVAADAAGNTSAAATTTVDKDTAAPGQPASLSGSPSPYVAGSTTFTVSGTSANADALATGLVADITVSDINGTTADLVVNGVAISSGSFSTVFSAGQMATLADGTLTLTAVVRDGAGNLSPPRTATVAKNTTPLALQSASPAAGATVASPATISATYNESLNGTTSTITIKNKNNVTVSGTTGTSGATITFTPSSPLTSAGSPYEMAVHAVDAGDSADTADDASSFRVDSTPPAKPTITSVTDPVNNGNKTAVTVTGSAGEAGATVTVTLGGSVTATTTSTAGGGYTVSGIDVTSLPDGPVSVTAASEDAVGNDSPVSEPASTTKDTVNPTKTSSSPATGTTVTPPATLTVTFDETLGSGSIAVPGLVGTSSFSGSTVTFTPASTIPDGTYTATASVTDTRGNGGTGTTVFTVDGTAPAKPTITAVTDPIVPANQANTAVTGNAGEAGLTVTVTIGDGTATVTESGTSGPGGAYTVGDINVTSLADGTLTVTSASEDGLGHDSPVSDPASTTKDTVNPTKTTSTPADGSTVTPPATVTVGFSESLASGSISIPGVAGTSSFSGSSVTFNPAATIPDGTYTATATVTDLRGNPGTGAATFTVDDELAASSTTLNPLPSTVTALDTIVLSGTVARGDTSASQRKVRLAVVDEDRTGRVIGEVTPAADGTWSLAVRPTTNGTYTATYLGDDENAASTSAERTVQVKVLISAKAKTGAATKKARVKGSVTPNKAGAKIRLYVLNPDGSRDLVGKTTIGANGRYKFKLVLPQVRTKLLVEMRATTGNLGNSVKLTARRT